MKPTHMYTKMDVTYEVAQTSAFTLADGTVMAVVVDTFSGEEFTVDPGDLEEIEAPEVSEEWAKEMGARWYEAGHANAAYFDDEFRALADDREDADELRRAWEVGYVMAAIEEGF